MVELPALVIGGSDNQHTLTCLVCGEIFPRDCVVSIFGRDHFAHAILLLEKRQCTADSALRGERDGPPQVWVALASYGVAPRDRHARLLHLINRSPRLDCMMLSLVAEKDDAIDLLLASGMKKRVHLSGGQKAGFIHDPELILAAQWRWILHKARDRARVYACF